jgi:hypothetical protein
VETTIGRVAGVKFAGRAALRRRGLLGAGLESGGARSRTRWGGAALGPITPRFSGPGLPMVAPAAERARWAAATTDRTTERRLNRPVPSE